jgi:lysine 2,3-aminomutase
VTRRFDVEGFPELVTPHLRRLIEVEAAAGGSGVLTEGPIGRQFIATGAEAAVTPYELADPLGEAANSPAPRLVRKYRDRALLLVTDTCAAHCRYCFRRDFTGRRRGAIPAEELEGALDYLLRHREIRELLLSGGDPLTLPVEEFTALVTRIRRRLPELVLRICTRVPVVAPERVTRALVRGLRSALPTWVVVQVNHPSELTPEVADCLAMIVDSGLPIVSQTVLLRGVNDSVETLEALCSALVALRVKPYQLFQCDLVRGTAYFRVPLERGVAIYTELTQRLSTLALPVYSVDAPGGGGKIALGSRSLEAKDGSSYLLEAPDGTVHRYPDETSGF